MDIIELLNKFLKTKGLDWEDHKIYDEQSDLVVTASEYNFTDLKPKSLLVTIENNNNRKVVLVRISVNLFNLYFYGLEFDTTYNIDLYYQSQKYKNLKTEADWSKEWRSFLIENKGLVYRCALEEEKRKLRDESHKK